MKRIIDPMKEPNNDDRYARALHAITEYCNYCDAPFRDNGKDKEGGDAETYTQDLITDLLHLCNRRGFDAPRVLRYAIGNFADEISESGEKDPTWLEPLQTMTSGHHCNDCGATGAEARMFLCDECEAKSNPGDDEPAESEVVKLKRLAGEHLGSDQSCTVDCDCDFNCNCYPKGGTDDESI